MSSDLFNKFKNLRDNRLNEYTPEAQDKIIGLEKSLKRALLADNLLEHDGIKMLVEKYKAEVDSINERLMNKEDMDEVERLLLFERRNWCREFLSYFERAKATISTVSNLIDETENQ